MIILGISAFYHDSAAALIKDGQIVAAAQEERFTRVKADMDFPREAVRYCLAEGGYTLQDCDCIVFYDKPLPKFERLLETYLAFAPKGFTSFRAAMPIWLREKLFLRNLIEKELKKIAPGYKPGEKLLFSEHHLSHAASAFYPSPFDEALILTLDGVGEWSTSSVAIGRGKTITVEKELRFPHSLGLLYSAMTYYTGFKVNSGEYKVMGLAPYGRPTYTKTILDHLIDLKADGTFRLNMEYFDFATELRMTNDKFDELFGRAKRRPEELLDQRHMDLAASIQAVTEEIMLRLTRSLAAEYRMPNLCLAGGVALNCVANGKILREAKFERIWIQPAAGDAGGALGAALAVHYATNGAERVADPDDSMSGSYLGPAYAQDDIENRLSGLGAKFSVLDEDNLIRVCAKDVAEEKALGWFQGRMEFGPRALGSRSIIGDARSPTMQKTLNLKIKYRESFRPFAPAVLAEKAAEWFDLNCESPYMLLVADVRNEHRRADLPNDYDDLFGIDKLNIPRSSVPAVTHVDFSARVQTVRPDTNPRYHALIQEFDRLTGCPVVVNTSFNVRGEPIVCTPEDAFRCFMGTEIDALAIGNCYLEKSVQTADRRNYKDQFELD